METPKLGTIVIVFYCNSCGYRISSHFLFTFLLRISSHLAYKHEIPTLSFYRDGMSIGPERLSNERCHIC